MSPAPAASDPGTPHGRARRARGRYWRALVSEISPFPLRLMLAGLVARFLPPLAFARLRTALYRAAGIAIGPHTHVSGRLTLIGPGCVQRRLRIGAHCWMNVEVFADLTDHITIGDHVTLGHHVVLITAHHQIGPPWHRAGPVRPAPIVIGDGAWISARATILPGVTIGAGAVVGAGSVVTRDVPPNTLAVGIPARVLRTLDGPPEEVSCSA